MSISIQKQDDSNISTINQLILHIQQSIELNGNTFLKQHNELLTEIIKVAKLIKRLDKSKCGSDMTPEQLVYAYNFMGSNSMNIETIGLGPFMNKIETDLRSRGIVAPWLPQIPHNIQLGTDGEADSKVYSMFPIPDEDIDDWNAYCAQEAQFWSAKELKMADDHAEYPTLPKRLQQLYKDCLGFFAPGDGLISKSALRFLNEAKRYSQQTFLIIQLAIEAVHSEAYGLAISSIIDDENERKEVFNMVDQLDCVKAKAQFIKDLVDSNAPANERLLAAACCEGIFFVTLFAIIYYLKNKNVMNTFIFLNKQVSADEQLHRDYYANAVRKMGCPERSKMISIISKAVDIEIGHMRYILREPVDSREQDDLMMLTIDNISNYAKGLGDQILVLCGESPYYNVTFDLPWMTDMSVSKKSNFYERSVQGYKRIAKLDAQDWELRAGLRDDVIIHSNIIANPEQVNF